MKIIKIIIIVTAISVVFFYAVVGAVFLYATQGELIGDSGTCDDINIRENAYTKKLDYVCEIKMDYPTQVLIIMRSK